MINVVLDAKNQSLKLCSADGLDMVSVQHFILLRKMWPFSCHNFVEPRF